MSFANLLGLLAGRVLRIRRRHVELAMGRAGIAPGAIARTADRMYASLGRGILELLQVRFRPEAPSPYRLTPALAEALVRARETGAVLASGHTGNWELAGARIAREIGLTAIVGRQSVGWAHRFIERVRRAAGIELLYPDASSPLGAARDAVGKKRAVFMMIDQRPATARHANLGEFLGAPAWITRGPAALAARTRAPMLLLGMHRAAPQDGDDGALTLDLLASYHPPERPGPRWVAETMRAATAELDAFVRRHPTDWMWLHRRWAVISEAS